MILVDFTAKCREFLGISFPKMGKSARMGIGPNQHWSLEAMRGTQQKMGDGLGAHHSLEFSRQETWGSTVDPTRIMGMPIKHGVHHFFHGQF